MIGGAYWHGQRATLAAPVMLPVFADAGPEYQAAMKHVPVRAGLPRNRR